MNVGVAVGDAAVLGRPCCVTMTVRTPKMKKTSMTTARMVMGGRLVMFSSTGVDGDLCFRIVHAGSGHCKATPEFGGSGRVLRQPKLTCLTQGMQQNPACTLGSPPMPKASRAYEAAGRLGRPAASYARMRLRAAEYYGRTIISAAPTKQPTR
jgi:hypothetical protein